MKTDVRKYFLFPPNFQILFLLLNMNPKRKNKTKHIEMN